MKNILMILIALTNYPSCKSQSNNAFKSTDNAIYKYDQGRFLLLDSSSTRVDTIYHFTASVVDVVVDLNMHNNKCVLIYRNNTLVTCCAFEKINGKWNFSVSQIILLIYSNTGKHDFKILDENHVRVKEESTKKVKNYEIDYLKKQVSFTETIDH